MKVPGLAPGNISARRAMAPGDSQMHELGNARKHPMSACWYMSVAKSTTYIQYTKTWNVYKIDVDLCVEPKVI